MNEILRSDRYKRTCLRYAQVDFNTRKCNGTHFQRYDFPLLNEQIVKEYREVLGRSKFHLTDEIIDSVVDEIERLGIYVDAGELDLVFPDPKDRVFYEVVMEKRKSEDAYLVTGNTKHFPVKPYVVTPRQMLDIIIGNTEN